MNTPSTNKCHDCGKELPEDFLCSHCDECFAKLPTEPSVCGVIENAVVDCRPLPSLVIPVGKCLNPKPCPLHEKPSVCGVMVERPVEYLEDATWSHTCTNPLPCKDHQAKQEEASWEDELMSCVSQKEVVEFVSKLIAQAEKRARIEERVAELHAVFVRLGTVPTSEQLNSVLDYINGRLEVVLKLKQ